MTHTKGRGVNYRKIRLMNHDCGCNSGSSHRDAFGSLKKKLLCHWNSILPEPGQPSTQLYKLTCLTACKQTNIQLAGGIGQFISRD